MGRILLVDDEKVAQKMYGDYLLAAGHEVTVAGNVPEARSALEQQRFDAVVTDLLLPEGDGMEVLRLAKESSPDTEVIVITGLDKVDPAVRAIKGGAAEYLMKPVTPEGLQHAITRALTTRHLLEENAALRRHVALVEAGQRLVSTLDRARLLPAAATTFAQLTEADASAIFVTGRQGEWVLEVEHGVPAEANLEIKERLLAGLSEQGPGFELKKLPGGFGRALGFPVGPPATPLACVALLYRKTPSENVRPTATYLAHHVGLALENVGRFAAVEDLAYLDDLTHLYNARYLDLALEREIEACKKAHTPFSLLFLDLDYFKSINDTHGHLVGSKLLVEVAKVIKSCTRDPDVVTRYGGDEYVVLLRETDSGGALKVAERIRRTVESHHFLAREGYRLSISTCIGIASYPEHAQDKATLLDLADRAMYRGKKTSRNVIYMAARDLEATPTTRKS